MEDEYTRHALFDKVRGGPTTTRCVGDRNKQSLPEGGRDESVRQKGTQRSVLERRHGQRDAPVQRGRIFLWSLAPSPGWNYRSTIKLTETFSDKGSFQRKAP